MTGIDFHPDLVRFSFIAGIVVSIILYEKRRLTTGGIIVPGHLGLAIFMPQLIVFTFMSAALIFVVVHILLPRFIIISKSAKFGAVVVGSCLVQLTADALSMQSGATAAASPLLAGLGYIIPGLIAHDFARHGPARTTTNVVLCTSIVAAVLLIVVVLFPQYGVMHETLGDLNLTFHAELMPLAIFFSAIAGMAMRNKFKLKAGGILGSAYIALLITRPLELIAFLVLSSVTLLITHTVLMPRMVLFGRRKFAAILLVGSCLSWLYSLLSVQGFSLVTPTVVSPSLTIASVLIVGLIASDVERVGAAGVAIGTAISVAFTLSGTLLFVELATTARSELVLVLAGLLAASAAFLFGKPFRLVTPHFPTARKGETS